MMIVCARSQSPFLIHHSAASTELSSPGGWSFVRLRLKAVGVTASSREKWNRAASQGYKAGTSMARPISCCAMLNVSKNI
jgi:hypothetical protein